MLSLLDGSHTQDHGRLRTTQLWNPSGDLTAPVEVDPHNMGKSILALTRCKYRHMRYASKAAPWLITDQG